MAFSQLLSDLYTIEAWQHQILLSRDLLAYSSFYDTSDYTDNFNSDAKFIWAEGYDAHDIVYCRARLCYRKQLSNSLN